VGGVLILGESVRLRPPLLVEYIEHPEFMTWCLLVGDFVALLLSLFLCTPPPREELEVTVINSSSVRPPPSYIGYKLQNIRVV